MSSAVMKPSTSSKKIGDPVSAILNRARSTLSQSRQFRDPVEYTVLKPALVSSQRDPTSSSNVKPKHSKVTIAKDNNGSSVNLDKDNLRVSPNSMDDLLGRTKTILEQKSQHRSQRGDASSPPPRGQNSTVPAAPVVQQSSVPVSSTKSAANYDYDSIFSNANTSKRVGRSDFNIFNINNASATVPEVTKGSVVIKTSMDDGFGPPEKLKKSSNVRFRSSSNFNQNQKQIDDEEQDEDSNSESEGSSSYGSSSTEGESTENEENNDDEESTTITPPTITETHSKSLSSNKKEVVNIPMNLKAITVGDESDYLVDSRKPNQRKIKVQDLRDKPLVFLSHESHAVFKAMSSPEKDEDVESYSKQFDPTPPKSYTEDFVSEIQSVADDFSKSFARSVSLVGDSVEVPQTESDSISEIPLELDRSETGESGSISHRKLSVKNAITSLEIVKAIKGNLQDLEISEDRTSLSEEESEDKSKQETNPTFDEYSEELVDGQDSSSEKIIITTSSNKKSTTDSSKPRKRADSIISSASGINATKTKRSANLVEGKNSIKIEPVRSKTLSPDLPQQKLSTQFDPNLSRQSSRKVFQAALSQVKLQDDTDEPPHQNLAIDTQPDKEKVKKLEEVYKFKIPKTKAQTQIHSILEKEVYRKELHRLRKINQREDKEIQKINETRMKNYKTVKEMEKKRERKVKKAMLDFAPEYEAELSTASENWGAPYFHLDASLRQQHGYGMEDLPRSSDDYVAKVANMDIPQLVREVVKSNERMYKMTIQAAKQMSKEYGKNVKLARKLKESQPAKHRVMKI